MKFLPSMHHVVWIRLKALVVLFLCQMPGMALPQGGQVTQGVAVIQQVNDTKLNINQSTDRAVINWNSFSIAPQEWVNFQQPTSTSATLNRVTGSTPSSIAGRLTANGQVFLVNPNGIAFLPTAHVDVAGLVASTLNIQDSDFMRGVLRFEQMPGKPPASVVNQGLITVKEAGFAGLVAPAVQNSGIISARLGKVVLASGTTVSLDFYGDGLLSVMVDPTLAGQITDIYGNKLSSLIDNQGNITVPGGIVTLTAQAAGQIVDNVINTGGIIEAKYAENRNGVIVLSGGSQGTVAVSGDLNVSGEKGGKVEITGQKIVLNYGTTIDASGDRGAGIINVGGSFQGKGPLPNALETTVTKNVQIKADTLTQGDGGEVIFWADGTTTFAGFISAKGGIISGDGGFAEVSGKEHLLMSGSADLSATNGKFGTLLLDPRSVTIYHGDGKLPNFYDSWINAQLRNANLTITTPDNGLPSSILVNPDVNISWDQPTTLTLKATQNIIVRGRIENTSVDTGFDAIVMIAEGKLPSYPYYLAGIQLEENARLITKGGNIRLTGHAGPRYAGIHQSMGTEVSSVDGNITYIGGPSESTSDRSNGIVLSSGVGFGAYAKISTTGTGAITLIGTGYADAGRGSIGIVQSGRFEVSSVDGDITYIGTSGSGGNDSYGILVSGFSDAKISTTGKGSITLTGTSQGTGIRNIGIYNGGGQVSSVDGNITYIGTGGISEPHPDGSYSHGILLSGPLEGHNGTTKISTTGKGTISFSGTARGIGSKSYGIVQVGGAEVSSIEGKIVYTGTGIFANDAIHITGGSNIIGGKTAGTISFTSTNNPITLNDVKVKTADNILINSPAQVTQNNSGGLFANGLKLTGFGSFSLTNSNNDIKILVADTTNNIKYTDVNGFQIGALNSTEGVSTTKNLTLKAGGAVTQSQAIKANGLELLGSGAYTLTNSSNKIKILAANTTNDIEFTNTDGFKVDTINRTDGIITTKNLTLKAGGAVTQNQALKANGLELLGSGEYTLTHSSNDIKILAANTTHNIKLTDIDGFDIGIVNKTYGVTTLKNLTLKADGTVTQSQPIIPNRLELLGSGEYKLTNSYNNISVLAADTTNNIKYTDINDFQIGTINATNGITTTKNLTLKAGGTVTQKKAVKANSLELLGDGAFNLNDSSNKIKILAANTTNNIKFTNIDGFEIGTVNKTHGVTTTKNLALEAGDIVTQSKAIVAHGLALFGYGRFNLLNSGNTVNIVAGDTNNQISLVNSQTLRVGEVNTPGITTIGNVFLRTISGDIILDKPINSSSRITLVADRGFINNVGKNALIASKQGGRWLVYTSGPAANSQGFPVLGGTEEFGVTYPIPPSFEGNGFLYKLLAGSQTIPELPTGLFSGSLTESVTFTLNFNNREWQDLSDMGEIMLFPGEMLLCVSVPINQSPKSPPIDECQ